jgi:hypothetical protein
MGVRRGCEEDSGKKDGEKGAADEEDRKIEPSSSSARIGWGFVV